MRVCTRVAAPADYSVGLCTAHAGLRQPEIVAVPLHPDDFAHEGRALGLGSAARPIGIRWLGAAGYELTCDGYRLLIDPYVTRVSLRRFLFSPIHPDVPAVVGAIPSADGVLVGHSHFDHVMDVPVIAHHTQAPVWGSASTANLLRSRGVPEGQIRECVGGEEFEVGPFRVRVVESEHSPFGLGNRPPFPGDIPESCDCGALRGSAYRCGQTFGFSIRVDDVSIYHCGSANLIDSAITERDVDLALVCIAARRATDRFLPRILRRLSPRFLVPTHYDNFFRDPRKGLRLLPGTAFGRFVDEVHGIDRQITLATLPIEVDPSPRSDHPDHR